MNAITLIVAHLPEREAMLDRAIASVRRQTFSLPVHTIVQTDYNRDGEHITRNRALLRVNTPLVAFLDDDDELLPNHLEVLYNTMSPEVDVVYSDYETVGAPGHKASFIQVTNLVRTEAIRAVGGFPRPYSKDWPYRYSDWGLWAKMLVAGYTFRMARQVTWKYHIHGANSSGAGL